MAWRTLEDVERDMMLYAEMYDPNPPEDAPVPKALQIHRQIMEHNNNVFDKNDQAGLSFVVSGRGRGIKDRIIHPGIEMEYHPSDEDDLKKQIRDVSGLGYSNKRAEEAIKVRIKASKEAPQSSDSSSESTMVPQLQWTVVDSPRLINKKRTLSNASSASTR